MDKKAQGANRRELAFLPGLVLAALGLLTLLAGPSLSQVLSGARFRAAFGPAPSPTPVPAPTWGFIGPEPMSGALANFGGPLAPSTGTYNATGRVTAIAVDPASLAIFVGTANGGVWKSTDSGNNFQPITDSLPTQAIGAIALDPSTTPTTIYLATGEANQSPDSYYGQGIFRSTDLGATWKVLSPGTFFKAAFTKLAINGSVPSPTPTPTPTPAGTPTSTITPTPTSTPTPLPLFAAAGLAFSAGRADPRFLQTDATTKSGLWRSTDGGSTWMHLAPTAFMIGTGGTTFTCTLGSPNEPCPADDVAIDPKNPKNVYAAIDSEDVFDSTDGGSTWAPACFSNNNPCTFPGALKQIGRESIGVGPPAPGAPSCSGGNPCATVYAMLGAPDGIEYTGFFKSTDGGVHWAAGTIPSFFNPITMITIDGTSPANLSQSSFDQTLLVSPGDSTGSTVFFGGVGIYESTNSGGSWSFLAQNGGTHSDQHALTIAPDNNTVYLGNDGGAYKFLISGIAGGVAAFTSLNKTIGAGQIQSIAPHPTNNARVLAGFQDNGTQAFLASLGPFPFPIPGTLVWNSVETFDGGFTLFDHTNPNFAYHTFATSRSAPLLSRSTDGGSTWDSVDPTSSILFALQIFRDAGANLYPPIANDPAVAGRVLFGAHFIYVSTDGMLTWQQQESADLTGGCVSPACALQDIEFARSDDSKAWAVSLQTTSTSRATPFKVFNTTRANLNSGAVWNDVTANLHFNTAATQATGITIDPNRATTAYLSLSGSRVHDGIGHVYRTTDFGASWVNLDGPLGGSTSLPDVPVLRILVDRSDLTGAILYAGTDTGIFRSTDCGTTWSSFNEGVIPVVPVFDIEENDNNILFAGTHGRGAFSVPAPTPAPVALTVSPGNLNFGSALVFGNRGVTVGPLNVNLTDIKSPNQNRPVLIQNLQVVGDFAIKSNNCRSAPLVPGAGCTIKMTFTPTASGQRTGSLTLFDTASNAPQIVSLVGKGAPGKVIISPSTLFFPATKVLSKSQPQLVRVINTNSLAMGIASISVTGADPADFVISSSCGSSLAARGTCAVGVAFAPTATGMRSASLTFVDDAAGSPQQVNLSGMGR